MLGDAGPVVPKRILCAPGVAEVCAGVLRDAFVGKFRDRFFYDILEFESRKEIFPFLLEGACGKLNVVCRKCERKDAVSGTDDETDGFVRPVVALACDIKECAGGAECFFGVRLGE